MRPSSVVLGTFRHTDASAYLVISCFYCERRKKHGPEPNVQETSRLLKQPAVLHAPALRQYRRNGEERLIYSNNRNLLFSHMNNAVTNNKCNTIQLCTNGTALTDIESCNAFLEVFSANFCSSSNINLPTRQANDAAQATLASFNCTPTDVAAALQSCPNSSSREH